MRDQLKELKTKSQNGNGNLSITFNNDKQKWNELLEYISNNQLQITKINIEFDNQVSLVDRSTMLLEFIQTLDHISGLKDFTLDSTVKDYALKALLDNESIQKLESLTFVHRPGDNPEDRAQESNKPVNSNVFLETSLVGYINKNQSLKLLNINDVHEFIRPETNPKLKEAIGKHPKLTTFTQGLHLSPLMNGTLDADPELVKMLEQKIKADPVLVKQRLDRAFIIVKSKTYTLAKELDDIVIYRKRNNPKENTWLTCSNIIDDKINYLNNIENGYKKLPGEVDQLSEKTAFLNVLRNYLNFAKKLTMLRGAQESNPALSSTYTDQFEQLWDTQRISLLERIEKVKDNNYSEILKDIEDTSNRLISIEKETDTIKNDLKTGLQTFNKLFKALDHKIAYLEDSHSKIIKDPRRLHWIPDNTVYKPAVDAAKKLRVSLKNEVDAYLVNPSPETYDTFKKNANKSIETARDTLKHHRGWSAFLTNLALGILGGVGLIAKGVVNVATNKSFFFVHKTDSEKVLDSIKKDINDLEPGKKPK